MITLTALALAMSVVADAAANDDPVAFEVIAHRGASANAPENTLAAFEDALAQGTLHLELDVQLTKDRRVAVFHDGALAEKTSAPGGVGDHELAFLQGLDLAPWFAAAHPEVSLEGRETRIPSLRQVLERFGTGPVYHVELKGREAELPGRVVELIRALGLVQRVRVSSFEFEQLERARQLEPGLFLCWLLPPAERFPKASGPGRPAAAEAAAWRRDRVDQAAAAGLAQVGVTAREVDRELVAYARGRGIDVRAWRVDSLEALALAHAAGVSGATVNWPRRALAWLANRGVEPR